MANLIPFKYYTPFPPLAEHIAINSYDKYSPQEINEVLQNNELSFINIIHKEATLHRSDFYVRVRNHFKNFVKNEWFIPSSENSFLIYRKSNKDRTYIGIIALSDVRDIDKGTIHLHEKTIEKRENILAQYIKEVKLNAEPVALIYNKRQKLQEIIQNSILEKPFISFRDKEQETHELWSIKETEKIKTELTQINYLLVADGHHRIMSSLRNYKENNAYPYFMSILFDDENVDIEPYREGEKKYTFEEIKTITLRGEVLPPKSTWILPKLKTGLVVYDFK